MFRWHIGRPRLSNNSARFFQYICWYLSGFCCLSGWTASMKVGGSGWPETARLLAKCYWITLCMFLSGLVYFRAEVFPSGQGTFLSGRSLYSDQTALSSGRIIPSDWTLQPLIGINLPSGFSSVSPHYFFNSMGPNALCFPRLLAVPGGC